MHQTFNNIRRQQLPTAYLSAHAVNAARDLLQQSTSSTTRASELQTTASTVLEALKQLAEAAELSDVEALEQ